MLVGMTDVPPGMSYRQVARKSVAMSLSDLAAKGVLPDSYLVSLGIPRNLRKRDIVQLARGFADAGREWKVNLVGGDTSEALDLVIDCTILGFSKRIVPRSGARPGQLVVTSGPFGYSAAGMKILLGGANSQPDFRVKAIKSVLKPAPRLKFGLVLSSYLSSSIDSSDGLAICLHTIAEMSQVGMDITNLPTKDDVVAFAQLNKIPLDELVLFGGEEYEIVGTVEERLLSKAKQAARAAGQSLIVIGKVTNLKGRIRLERNGTYSDIPKKGWIHLR